MKTIVNLLCVAVFLIGTAMAQHPVDEQAATTPVFLAGGGVGSVAGVNLAAECREQQFSFGLSGGWWSKDYYGVAALLAVPVITIPDFRGDLALTGGVHSVPRSEDNDNGSKAQQFVGAGFQFHYTNFYVLAGLEFGFNDKPANLQPLFQFGYLFRLN